MSWSTDLTASLSLVPQPYNFSLGQQDSVFWAWIQPNHSWEPSEYESQHGHPDGSGLVVAHTAGLALTSATLILRLRRTGASV